MGVAKFGICSVLTFLNDGLDVKCHVIRSLHLDQAYTGVIWEPSKASLLCDFVNLLNDVLYVKCHMIRSLHRKHTLKISEQYVGKTYDVGCSQSTSFGYISFLYEMMIYLLYFFYFS